MPLKAGNLKTLVLNPSRTVSTDDLADIVLHQMLLALACIAEHKIVHRDLKPENVLWEYDPDGNYHFRLGDFGLSNNPELAVTVAGTEPFMAPEVFHRQKQTEKVDIWSLFATIVWVKNIGSFRQSCARYSAPAIHNWLVQIAGMEQFCNIRRMASVRAKDRPSARQLLRIISGGGRGGEKDELADSLQNALTLDPTGSEDDDDDQQPTARIKRPAAAAADEQGVPVPYYEPYPPSPENYAWEPEDGSDNNGEGGGSTTDNKVYAPPQMGQSPRAGGGGAGPLAEVYFYHPLFLLLLFAWVLFFFIFCTRN
jgi:serine/threonine protein kinase